MSIKQNMIENIFFFFIGISIKKKKQTTKHLRKHTYTLNVMQTQQIVNISSSFLRGGQSDAPF